MDSQGVVSGTKGLFCCTTQSGTIVLEGFWDYFFHFTIALVAFMLLVALVLVYMTGFNVITCVQNSIILSKLFGCISPFLNFFVLLSGPVFIVLIICLFYLWFNYFILLNSNCCATAETTTEG